MRLNLPVVVAAAFLLAACSTPSDEGASSDSGGDSAAPASTSAPSVATTPAGAKEGSQLDLEINVGDRVFFDFDKSTLRPNGRTTIERWAGWLKTYPANKIIVEGHADERGTREYNLALGVAETYGDTLGQPLLVLTDIHTMATPEDLHFAVRAADSRLVEHLNAFIRSPS